MQLAILKRYTGNYMLATQKVIDLVNAKVQDYEINATTQPMYRTEMWRKA